MPVRIDLSGVCYQDKDGNAIDATLGVLRQELTYDPALVAPALEANAAPGRLHRRIRRWGIRK